MNVVAALLTGLAALVLGGCGSVTTPQPIDAAAVQAEAALQRELALERLVSDRLRLGRLAYRVAHAAAPLCGERVTHEYGVMLANRRVFGEAFSAAAAKLYGVDQRNRVLSVVPGSPAERAGLVARHHVIKANGKTLPPSKAMPKTFERFLDEGKGAPAIFTLAGGRAVFFAGVEVCDFTFDIIDKDIVNAFADGTKVILTRGMMRFAQCDEELALVVAHETAHNIMGHIGKKFGKVLIGSVLDILFAAATGVQTRAFSDAAALVFSKEFEAEADYVGLYIMARARLPIDAAPRFWRRMGASFPKAISHATTHPSSPHRFVALANAVKEIEAKQAAGAALLPNIEVRARHSTAPRRAGS